MSVDTHNPYDISKDTALLNKVMSNIFEFQEARSINKQINKNSKGMHGVSIMVEDELNGDTSYYHFMVGDNSHVYRYENICDFLLEKKTGQIKAYNNLSDSIMSMDNWRKNSN